MSRRKEVRYMRHLIVPVHNDDGTFECYDIHEGWHEFPLDEDPVAENIATLGLARERIDWICRIRRLVGAAS